MRLPDHIIDQVRSRADIVEVIGEHVRLKKTGRNYVGLCPFHNEKTPSFNVNAERGIYKCFGCGKGGNVITFMTDHGHLGFVDAVRALATRYGIVIPTEEQDDPTGMHARRDAALAALREAATFYRANLETDVGAEAARYFERRGFTTATIDAFQLGASPAGWDGLMRYLRERGYADEHLVDAGLVVVREDGRMYDRFRGRAMFAIADDAGRIVGFSARILTDDPGQPKYINSPQGPVFDKSRVLYGLDRAKRSIAEARTAILVEGQTDVVSLHQTGLTRVVASSGTSLTADHCRTLRRHADTLVLLFDADNAGQNATTRAVELALAAGLDVRVCPLPAGADPDSLARDGGRAALDALLADDRPWIAWQADRLQAQGQLDDAVSQARAVRMMLTWIRHVPDTLRHPFLVRELAERFRLHETTVLRELDNIPFGPGPTTGRAAPAATTSARQGPTSPPSEQGPPPAPASALVPPERELLRVALTVPHGLALLLNRFHCSVDTFRSERGRRIFQRMIVADEEHPSDDGASDTLIHHLMIDPALTADDVMDLAGLSISPFGVSERWLAFQVELPPLDYQRAVRDAIVQLRILDIAQQADDVLRLMSQMADQDERQRAAYRLQQLVDRRQELTRRLTSDPEDLSWLDVDIPSAPSSSA